MSDIEFEKAVTLITGKVWRDESDDPLEIHILLTAADDDSAVRKTLDALSNDGYERVELAQIGELDGEPDEEPYLSAWHGALEGEISIIKVKMAS